MREDLQALFDEQDARHRKKLEQLQGRQRLAMDQHRQAKLLKDVERTLIRAAVTEAAAKVVLVAVARRSAN